MGGNSSHTAKTSHLSFDQNHRIPHDTLTSFSEDDSIPTDDEGDASSLIDHNNDLNPNAFDRNYPPPCPPPNRKINIVNSKDFLETDRLAKIVEPDDYDSMPELVRALTQNFSKDIQKVRVIFIWIGSQPFAVRQYPPDASETSPLGHLRRMAHGVLSYAELFTVMCRYAGVPCVMIPGVAKSSAYEVGDEEVTGLRNMWNAVYVAGGWRIVFLLWALRAIVGRSTGESILTDLSNAKQIKEKAKEIKAKIICNVKEYYFLTDPDEFIYRCLPDEEKWQLVSVKMTRGKFLRVPYLRPKFFEYGLEMAGTREGIITTKDGVCDIMIKESEDHVPLNFDLLYNDLKSGKSLPPGIQLHQYGVLLNENGNIRFNMRLPAPGVYKLQVLDIDQEWVCSFKIICEKGKRLCEPFPAQPEIGYGPSKLTEECGLKAETHTDGTIKVSDTVDTDIVFTVTDKTIAVRAMMIHSKIPPEALQNFVTQRHQFDSVTFGVKVPKKGEYALVILAKTKGGDGQFYNVCNYILVVDSRNKNQRQYENATEKKVRGALKRTLLVSDDPEALQDAMNEFNQLDLKDNGEMEKAKHKIEYLNILTALKDGINRRNIDILEKAIADSKSCNNPDLEYMTSKAEKEAEKLQKLKKHGQSVLSMSQKTISELHRYKQPLPIIHDVMKATFLLLGEDRNTVERWPNLQNLMRKSGRDSLLGRVRKFDTVTVDVRTAKTVAKVLSPYDKETTTAASAGAGTFYIWASSIADDIASQPKV